MSTGLELVRAGSQHQSVLENLLELYIHDFSELVLKDVGDDGRFGYKNLALFWSDSSRLALLARLDNKLVGFALVTKSSEPSGDGDVWDMTEFFILRRYRRRGIGTQIAEKVWLECPGRWQIRVMEKNTSARRFWEASIEKFTGQPAQSTHFVQNGVDWHRFFLDTYIASSSVG